MLYLTARNTLTADAHKQTNEHVDQIDSFKRSLASKEQNTPITTWLELANLVESKKYDMKNISEDDLGILLAKDASDLEAKIDIEIAKVSDISAEELHSATSKQLAKLLEMTIMLFQQ